MNEEITTRLTDLEGVIERGLATFIEVGQALREIRDSRLYRERYSTFEDYCRERWEFNDRRASQLIAAAEVSTTVGTSEIPAPANEAVARELAPLRGDPERLRDVWARAVERGEGRPTALDVMAVKAEMAPEPEPGPGKPGVRKLGQHRKTYRAAVEWARHIHRLDEALDLTLAQWITEGEERDVWLQDLQDARATLSRLISALSRDE
jgi:hypothetical protein